MLPGTTARLTKAWWRLCLLDSLLWISIQEFVGRLLHAQRAVLVQSLKSHLQGLPSQHRNGCISHVQVLTEQKSPKQGNFRVERKKLLLSLFTFQRPRVASGGRQVCVTFAAAVTDCNPEDEEMLSEASFLSHYIASGRKSSC